ncbi:MAG: AmmeMemoRadiSam system protein B [Thermoplasmataceae archaeon]|jgi:AmmeMemoRadiSam system protein B
MNIREPSVAGSFYPEESSDLKAMIKAIESRSKNTVPEGEILGILVPHAGYIYSGIIAMDSFRILTHSSKRTFLILGPDHSLHTLNHSIQSSGFWRTPLGDAKINHELAKEILDKSKNIIEEPISHRYEHSIEVQIPFLQYMFGDSFDFVPIAMGDQSLESIIPLFNTISSTRTDFILIASSDLTHYESEQVVKEKDLRLLRDVVNLDLESFYSTLHNFHVTACGYGAIATLMMLTKSRRGKMYLIDHSTSANAFGDRERTVGYASTYAYVPKGE